ncbi:hypothetical protein [Mycoplana dimorpha]|uniref:Uncharacterized protein n=1 Tax=Mycoplana dimorpha TaxID=28320 RepID=A0A2T5AJR6_MYCDI|nr:hypothetical protein [Mycoplana dimorpha]PTM86960.1 hypothetical protein C7449_11513 [Mycoplana dimorpha]
MSRAQKTADYEKTDVQPRHILLAGLSLFVFVLLSIAVISGALYWLQPQNRAGYPVFAGEQDRGGPRLEVDPSADRAELQRSAAARLETYGWTDKALGRAHIPIERAMALLAEQGWPDKENGGASP